MKAIPFVLLVAALVSAATSQEIVSQPAKQLEETLQRLVAIDKQFKKLVIDQQQQLERQLQHQEQFIEECVEAAIAAEHLRQQQDHQEESAVAARDEASSSDNDTTEVRCCSSRKV
jgi:dsRNA-specific ribonuclease